jgi:O-antigen ligase
MTTSFTGYLPRSLSVREDKGHRTKVRRASWAIAGLMALHLPFGVLAHHFPLVSTVHAIGALIIAFACATSRRHVEWVAYAAAYIVGAEVLWRMTDATIFWEVGKYGVSAIFVIAMVLNQRKRLPVLPVLFFAMLIPSALLAIIDAKSATYLRGELSSYMSGPLALAVSACFFTNLKLTKAQLQKLLVALICPILAIGTAALYTTLTTSDLTFTAESNLITSGGFGPNQVSGILSLGGLAALIFILNEKEKSTLKILMFAVIIFLFAQSALTFSRGGLYNAAGGIVMFFIFFMKNRGGRSKLIFLLGLIVLIAYFVVLPTLDTFTGGAFSDRFEDTGLAYRDEIARKDLRLWQENPIFGVGPGGVAARGRVPHTEITRLLAEHGVLGLAAMLIFAGALILCIARKRGLSRAVAAALMGWGTLFLLDKAMRIVAPSFALGLVFATLLLDEESRPKSEPTSRPGRYRGISGPNRSNLRFDRRLRRRQPVVSTST